MIRHDNILLLIKIQSLKENSYEYRDRKIGPRHARCPDDCKARTRKTYHDGRGRDRQGDQVNV